MSLWSLLDGGISHPSPANNWRLRFVYWCGRRLASRHKNVTVPKSCRIHPGARINPRNGAIRFGENCIVADGAIIQGLVEFGENCSVQPYSILTGYGTPEEPSGKITIGNHVRIASHGMFIATNHNFDDPGKPICKQGLSSAPITIEDDVWIAGRVNITAGVTIGQGSVIGGGSVVTKTIPPMSVAVGAPARVIRTRG